MTRDGRDGSPAAGHRHAKGQCVEWWRRSGQTEGCEEGYCVAVEVATVDGEPCLFNTQEDGLKFS